MWRQGSVVPLEITDLASNGSSVGRFENRVVFVSGGVPGDRLLVRLVKVRPAYAEGRLMEILDASHHRVHAPCILSGKCGGCQWQNVAYPAQLVFKQKQVEESLKRIGKFEDITLEKIIESRPFGYRNRVIYALGRSKAGNVKSGCYQKGTHRIVNINQCPIQDPAFEPFLTKIKADLDRWEIYYEEKGTGALRSLVMRVGQRTGEVLITLVSTTSDLPGLHEQSVMWMEEFPSIVGICLNLHPDRSNRIFGSRTICLCGRDHVKEHFCGLELQIHSTAFFQINTEVAEEMVQRILSVLEVEGVESVVDGYAGIGTMILPIAKAYPRAECWAIDSHSTSIDCAKCNAECNNIRNLHFQVGKFEEEIHRLPCIPDVVLLDPPRKGCDGQVLDAILKIQPRRVIYVSCKPSTLARDLGILCHSGIYDFKKAIPVDLFPQTSHVETITLLRRHADETTNLC